MTPKMRQNRVVRDNVLDAVEDDLLPDFVLLQEFFDIDHLHVTRPYFKGVQAGPDPLRQFVLDSERLVGADNGNQDIAFVDDVAPDHAVDQVGRDDGGFLDEVQCRSRNVFLLGVDLFVGKEECFQIERFQGAIEGTLSPGPDKNGHERDRGEDDGPVAAMGDLVQAGREKDEVRHALPARQRGLSISSWY